MILLQDNVVIVLPPDANYVDDAALFWLSINLMIEDELMQHTANMICCANYD